MADSATSFKLEALLDEESNLLKVHVPAYQCRKALPALVDFVNSELARLTIRLDKFKAREEKGLVILRSESELYDTIRTMFSKVDAVTAIYIVQLINQRKELGIRKDDLWVSSGFHSWVC